MKSEKYSAALLVMASLAPVLSFAAPRGAADNPAPDQDANSGPATLDDLEEVVVVANRYEATDLQMRANNTQSVLSADDLSNTAVHNVAEALGLLSGVNVLNIGTGAFIGGVDGAARAEGRYVSLRGMNGEYNVNLINGVEVAQGSPYSRQVQLSLLPPSGLKTIVLNKTSRADMDGDAIGGTVDFRTPTAFEFTQPETNVSLGSRFESRANDYGRNNDGMGYSASLDGARLFGDSEQWGIYASAYYDKRNFANSLMGGVMESGCCDNGWAFAVANADGTNPSNLDPVQNLQLTAANFGVSAGSTERSGGNMSLDWRPDDTTTAYFRASYAYALTEQRSYLSQVVGMGVLQGAAGGLQIGTTNTYQPNIGGVSIRYWYETNPEAADLGTAQLGAEKKLGKWTFLPNVFYSWGRNDRPDHIEISARTSEAMGNGLTDNGFPFGQSTLFTSQNNFPVPQLTSAMAAQLSDLLSLRSNDRGELQKAYSDQTKEGARLDTTYAVERGAFQFVKFGAKYVHSKREVTFNDWTNPGQLGGTFGSLPIWSGFYSEVFPGKYNWPVPVVSNDALMNYFNSGFSEASLDTCGSIAFNNINCNTQGATEAVSATYAMLDFQMGNWQFLPGLRYEHTDVHNTFFLIPKDDDGNQLLGSFSRTKSSFNEVLPSIFANYRPNASSVYRAGIWRSYTRPPFAQLGSGSRSSASSTGTTTVTVGNPNLDAVTSTNFDLSGEWDTGHDGHFNLAGFYKALQNFINDTGNTTIIQVAPGVGTIITQPTNGGSGKVYGVEVAARQLFKWLPDPFNGLGVGGSVTREYTSVDLGDPNITGRERILNAPDWLANVEVFYEQRGVELGLIYNYSGEFISDYDVLHQRSTWDDLWNRPRRRLDMHAGYKFESGLAADLSISNLLKDYTYWSHIGKDSLAISDVVDSGLTALASVSYKFGSSGNRVGRF